jgi:hypothetical protein
MDMSMTWCPPPRDAAFRALHRGVFQAERNRFKGKDLRFMLMKLLLSFEQMEANKVRKGKVKELLRENAFSDFGKLM